MKKIFTLLVSAFIVGSAFAQYDQGNQKGYGHGNDMVYNSNDSWKHKKDHDSYSFSKRERDMQIAQINREYDYKIEAVKNRYFMSRYRKERIINELQDQRKEEIRNVWMKFRDKRNRFDDDDSRGRW